MTLQEFLLFITAVLVATTGQVLLKLGALKLGPVNNTNFLNSIFNILFTSELMIGLFFYGFSAILFILVLTRVKLSVAGPAASISYIFSVLLGYLLFQEAISIRQLLGLALIVCGVIFVVRR